ncbi:PEP-CTERM sorting domain-containing protein [Nostoc sp. WHI]|uniref:PEP-CTERM sorting domain-containing protein n=1 Tax=Nostoc sp. WHI TaxID=2650611 RepID=UPI0018C69250|nr:PEP-CTERM sorting domain-containing protein [Nostoc sp. WHI]MBG1265378.1 PEP-CTERM sorting domain-containing protein [Nostoc sp. WHI]
MTNASALKKLSMAATGAVMIALGVVETAQAQTIIDTTPSWNGTDSIIEFGEFDTATYGQTFTVGSDNILNDFTFFLNDFDRQSDVVDFAAYVAEWDGSKATGSILYQSVPQSTTNAPGFEQFTFNTGGIGLTSGKQYVAFLSASNFFDGTSGLAGLGAILFQDVYSGGDFVFYNNGSDFSLLTQNAWDGGVGNGFGESAFKASFSQKIASVPEPTTMLGVLAFGALGISSLHKRKQPKTTVKA